MVTVHYACDSVGNHKAETSQLIDADLKEFHTMDKAIRFAIECTECLNLNELLEKSGVSSSILRENPHEDLLLNSENFIRYRENV